MISVCLSDAMDIPQYMLMMNQEEDFRRKQEERSVAKQIHFLLNSRII